MTALPKRKTPADEDRTKLPAGWSVSYDAYYPGYHVYQGKRHYYGVVKGDKPAAIAWAWTCLDLERNA